MAFGPELEVFRKEPLRSKVNRLRLGECNVDDLPVFPFDDPAARFLMPELADALIVGDNHYLTKACMDPERIAWGCFVGDKPVGLIFLDSYGPESTLSSYGIALHPDVRSKGVGGLVTSAVLEVCFEIGLLAGHTPFDSGITTVDTAIHPDNVWSQKMCKRAGFERVPGWVYEVGDVQFGGYICEKAATQSATVQSAGYLSASASVQPLL